MTREERRYWRNQTIKAVVLLTVAVGLVIVARHLFGV